MPGDQLDRDDLIRGITAVIAKLRAAGQPAGIRIVGGAALALRYFDRRTTADIDAAEELLEAFFPGDGLPDKALRLLVPIFARGLPAVPETPAAPVF